MSKTLSKPKEADGEQIAMKSRVGGAMAERRHKQLQRSLPYQAGLEARVDALRRVDHATMPEKADGEKELQIAGIKR